MTNDADTLPEHAPVPVRNYRTRLEAELAAMFLAQADIPSVIQSTEGMLHGPLGPGATVLVRVDQVSAARAVLDGSAAEDRATPYRWILRAGDPVRRACARLDALAIPYLLTPAADGRRILFVRPEHAQRARRVLGRSDPEET